MADLPNRSPAGSEAGSLYEGSSGKGPTPLAELSKEDLIQRCKKLLQIAQKAKAAKDDALKELKKAKSQNESSAALEEMVSKLSEEKLKSANDIDNYKRSGLKLNEELEQLNNKYQDLEADFSIKQRKLDEIEEENGKLSKRFDELQEVFAVTKNDAKALSETVSKLEIEKAETSAKLICVQSENDKMKQELIQLKTKTNESDKQQCDSLQNMEQQLKEKETLIGSLEEKIKIANDSLDQLETEKKLEIEDLNARIVNECQTNEENLKIKDESIADLISSNDEIKRKMNEKDAIIEDLNIKIEDLQKNNTSLKLESEENLELKNALLEEQNKAKETEAKVIELTEFILARDETITQLQSEATKKLEELKELEENSNVERTSQINEIELLKNNVIDKENTIKGLKSELSLNVENLECFQKEKDNEIRQLISLRSELETKQRNIETSINSRDENIKDLKEKVASLEKENESLKEQRESEDASEIAGKETIIKDIQSELLTSKANLAEAESKCNDFQARIKTMEEDIKNSEQNFEDLTKAKLGMEKDIVEKDDTIATKEKEISGLSENMERCKVDINKFEKEQVALNKTLQEKDAEIETLKMTLERISSENENRGSLENQEIDNQKTRIVELEDKVKESSQKLNEIEEQNKDLIQDLQSKETTIAALTEELASLKKEVTVLKKELEKQENCVKEIDIEYKNLEEKLQSKEALMSEWKAKSESLATSATTNEAKIKQLEENLEDMKKENEEFAHNEGNSQKVKEENEELYTLNSKLEEKIQVLKDDLAALANTKAQIEEELESSESTVSQLADKIDDVRIEIGRARHDKETLSFELAEKETQYEAEIDKLRKDIEEKDELIKSLKQGVKDEDEKEKSRTAELLSEMNAMNTELKKRGERVNLLQEEREKLRTEVNSLSDKLSTAETKIAKLSDENRTMSPHAPVDDTMSTSTMSKVEQDTRMADIEATFEDRYSKLKLVAIKLKKKTVEQEKQISELISNANKSQETNGTDTSTPQINSGTKNQAMIVQKEKLAKAVKNLENLQTEYDAAQDTIEEQKSTISTLKKDIENSVAECVDIKEKLVVAEEQVSEKDVKLSEALDKLESCSKDINMVQDLKKENSQLSEDLKDTRLKLERLTGADKRHDLLDLELEEAEGRVKQLTASNTELKEKINTFEEELSREVEIRKNRDNQIKEIEETLSKEIERSGDLKIKLTESRSTISQNEIALVEGQAENQALKQDLNVIRNEKEKLACQLADISGSAVASAQSFTSKNESLQKMVNVLETDIARKKSRIEELEDRLATVEKDYNSYKVRAQSVLRQQQQPNNDNGNGSQESNQASTKTSSNSSSSQHQLKEKIQEIANLERVIESLNQKITEMSTRMAALTMESNHLNEDHERLMERHSTLLQEMAAKEKSSRDKHDQLLKLANQAERARQDAVANLQQETEALRQSYRSQIEGLQNNHGTEVSKMQKQIDDLENNVIRLQIQNTKESNSGDRAAFEREAAEGSDAIDPPQRPQSSANHHQTSYSNLHSLNNSRSSASPPVSKVGRSNDNTPVPIHNNKPMPLDQLLSQTDIDFNGDESLDSSYNMLSPTSLGQDRMSISELTKKANELNDDKFVPTSVFEELKVRATAAEKKSTHLSSLLSEAESENLRLSQMSTLLKEEIRSYRRSEERSKHIENLEYVKNIILKFVTMPGSDEKARLIPVLSTILKLSPAEVETVQKSVNIDAEEVMAQDAGGWSSYLGRWT